uniref:Uncharacterized protein n=1 Tax=Rhizophora mucronata TaxID=61149 RepID=A0A2P2JF45_RHIMU
MQKEERYVHMYTHILAAF